MKQTGLTLAAAVALCVFLAPVAVHAQEPTTPATPAADERFERLEAQLKEALARIEKLEAQLESAAGPQQPSSPPGTAPKPAKPAPAKRADESADFFPQGTKISGTFVGSRAGALAVTGRVLTRTATGAVLRLTNAHGTADYELRIKDGKAAITGRRGVSGANGAPPAQMSEFDINGTVDATTIRMSGNWRVKGSGKSDVSFELNADQ